MSDSKDMLRACLKESNGRLSEMHRIMEDILYSVFSGEGLQEIIDNTWMKQIAERGRLRKNGPRGQVMRMKTR